jgi:hypothetical protein
MHTPEAFASLSRNAIHGVGLGMSINDLFENNTKSVVLSFPSEIHNGFLLFAVENGIPASIFLLTFLYMVLRQLIWRASHYNESSAIPYSCALGLVGVIANSFFHPLLFPLRGNLVEYILILSFIGLYSPSLSLTSFLTPKDLHVHI